MSDTAHPRPRRPKKHRPGTNAFAATLLGLIKATPGQTIPALAEQMDCAQNQLYRVLPRMQKAGQVVKRGRGWYPTDSAEAAA
jgi:DNA-binding IclR family transcriptional regulator